MTARGTAVDMNQTVGIQCADSALAVIFDGPTCSLYKTNDVMNSRPSSVRLRTSPRASCLFALLLLMLLAPAHAHASMFKGEALDKMADVLTWLVLIVAPIVGIAVFWIVHILPEKIAEKRQHPQAKAIQCLCLLSLIFGGLLWPLAWLWAFSKPVLYKLAYGTDKVERGHEDAELAKPEASEADEVTKLRKRVAELESKLSGKGAADGGKA